MALSFKIWVDKIYSLCDKPIQFFLCIYQYCLNHCLTNIDCILYLILIKFEKSIVQ